MMTSMISIGYWMWLAGFTYISAFTAQPQSTMTIKGTSTIHDWEMKTEKVEAIASVLMEDQKLVNLNDFVGTIKVESLKSGKPGMDGNCYDALKYEKFPVITFKMKQLNKIDPVTKKISALFTVTIAGTTRDMVVDGVATEIENDFLRIRGEKALKMTDFKVTPPSFMFGSITTGDAITLVFDMVMATKK